MITKFKIFEKSSLTKLGINTKIMKSIQKDFALSDNAEWEPTNKKIDLVNELNNDKNVMIIQLSSKSTKILVKYKNIKYEYFVDEYLELEDDWESNWKKLKRVYYTKTELISEIKSHSLYFILKSGEFTNTLQQDRTLIKSEIKYNEFYDNFKNEVINNFTSIVKRIFKSKSEEIKKEILQNLEIETDTKSETELQKLLNKNIELNKKYTFYQKLHNLDDPYSLKSKERDDSLSIIDKKILEFEEEYSKYFKEFLNIQELCEHFTRDRIITEFFYFLYSGKIYNK
jgi:hypothetical protein